MCIRDRYFPHRAATADLQKLSLRQHLSFDEHRLLQRADADERDIERWKQRTYRLNLAMRQEQVTSLPVLHKRWRIDVVELAVKSTRKRAAQFRRVDVAGARSNRAHQLNDFQVMRLAPVLDRAQELTKRPASGEANSPACRDPLVDDWRGEVPDRAADRHFRTFHAAHHDRLMQSKSIDQLSLQLAITGIVVVDHNVHDAEVPRRGQHS